MRRIVIQCTRNIIYTLTNHCCRFQITYLLISIRLHTYAPDTIMLVVLLFTIVIIECAQLSIVDCTQLIKVIKKTLLKCNGK